MVRMKRMLELQDILNSKTYRDNPELAEKLKKQLGVESVTRIQNETVVNVLEDDIEIDEWIEAATLVIQEYDKLECKEIDPEEFYAEVQKLTGEYIEAKKREMGSIKSGASVSS